MQQVDPALTIVPADHIRKPEDEESEESSSEEEEVDLPPGPISSEHCTVGGPGFVGGAAKANISFYVTAKDETDKRIREGGAYVTATVNPGNSARAGGAELVFADIRDNGDGTYTATYAVEARGDYEVSLATNLHPSLFACHAMQCIPFLLPIIHLCTPSQGMSEATHQCQDSRSSSWARPGSQQTLHTSCPFSSLAVPLPMAELCACISTALVLMPCKNCLSCQ